MAPCAAILSLDIESESERLYEIYFKGIFSCEWQSDMSHGTDLCLMLNTLVDLNTLEISSSRPSWVADSHARKLLMSIEEGAKQNIDDGILDG